MALSQIAPKLQEISGISSKIANVLKPGYYPIKIHFISLYIYMEVYVCFVLFIVPFIALFICVCACNESDTPQGKRGGL